MTVQTQHPSPGVERANAEVSNIAELVRLAARRGPEHPAVVDALSGAEFSWAGLDAAVSEQARRLRQEGVSAGDRVLLRLPTGPAFCVALFGALRAGAVAVPVSPSATSEERERILADCAPAALLADEPCPEASPAGPRELAPVRLDEFGTRALPTAETAEEASTTGSDLAVLAYTSGTSGPSRAAMLSHGALLANVRQCGRLRPMPVNSADRVLLALPLFHIYGLGPGLLQVASVGATAVLLPRFDAEAALDAISELRVTSLVGVPPMYYAWLQLPAERLRSGMATVRLLTSGAAPLGVEAATEVRAATGLDVFEGYGLTETGPVLTTTLASGRAKPGSVGAPLPGVELRLVDVDGQPLDSPVDAARQDRGAGWITGLVSARGPNLFSGYWPDGLHGPDRNGWFRTGDVGHFDEDGDLCLVDRVNDLVIVNGFNVYPHEVEDVLLRLDGVSEVAVVGVPDGSSGEALGRGRPAPRGRALRNRRAGALRAGARPVQGADARRVRRAAAAVDDRQGWPAGTCATSAKGAGAGASAARTMRVTPAEAFEGGPALPESPEVPAPGPAHAVTVMTRADCPGCAAAVEDVRRICTELGVPWSAEDVDSDPELRAEFGDRVPVILLDGAEHGFWQVEEPRLRAALAK